MITHCGVPLCEKHHKSATKLATAASNVLTVLK